MKNRIGLVCPFMAEEREHSSNNIYTVIDLIESFPHDEINAILVANGCKTTQTMQNRTKNLPNVKVLELSENIGVPAAWNVGIDFIDCDYLVVINDDVWTNRFCIDRLIHALRDQKNFSVSGVEGVICEKLDEQGFPIPKTKIKKTNNHRIFKLRKKEQAIMASNVSGFLFVISVDFIKKTKFRFDTRFSPAFMEEYDLAFHSRDNGYKTVIITGLESHYDHTFGISAKPSMIKFLSGSISSDALSKRNKRLFIEKWQDKIHLLNKP